MKQTKTLEQMIEVMQAAAAGKEIQWISNSAIISEWRDVSNPVWGWDMNDYRVKVKATPIFGIPWTSVAPQWRYAAMDSDGEVWVFTHEPVKMNGGAVGVGAVTWVVDDANTQKATAWATEIFPLNLEGVEAEFSLTKRP